MKKSLFLFAAFGCLGIAMEIFFTAIVDNINYVQAGEAIDWSLTGKSYIWMFPIYGLAGIFFPLAFHKLEHLHILLRICIYAIGILTVEFITGGLLDLITGSCPWDYTTGWHIMGYIRLDFFPFWALFGLLIERVYLLLRKIPV